MANLKKNYELTRVNYMLPTKLVERVKEYSYTLGVPMTQGVVLLLTKALDNNDVMTELPKVMEFIQDYKDGKFKELENSDKVS